MGEYIITLIGAGILCSLSEMIAPEKWNKYIKLFTGVIIAILIISPIRTIDMQVFDDFVYNEEEISDQVLHEEIQKELEKRISEDINKRIRETLKYSCVSQVKIDVDTEGKIKGVKNISINTKADYIQVKKIICSVYGISEEQVKVNGR